MQYRFLHIIKTGGSSLLAPVRTHLPGVRNLDHPDFNTVGKPVFLSGHDLRFASGHRNFIILRDPAEWLVSIYHHARSREEGDMTFEAWYKLGVPNSVNLIGGASNRMALWLVRMVTGGGGIREILEMLSKCWLIGLTNKLDGDLPALYRALGIPPEIRRLRVAGKYDEIDERMIAKTYTLTESMRERIYAENPLDVLIWEHAKAMYIPWEEAIDLG